MTAIAEVMKKIEQKHERKLLPFNVGDTIKVYTKVKEGKRERLQVFEGTVIGIKSSGTRKTFKVRKISFGVGVEKTFPYTAPVIDHIDLVRRGKVRRAKLYYLRDRVGKRAQVKRLDEYTGGKSKKAKQAEKLAKQQAQVKATQNAEVNAVEQPQSEEKA